MGKNLIKNIISIVITTVITLIFLFLPIVLVFKTDCIWWFLLFPFTLTIMFGVYISIDKKEDIDA